MIKFATRPNCILNMTHEMNCFCFSHRLLFDERHKYKYEEVIYFAICLLQ